MLSANREDVLEEPAWNEAIMSAAVELFVENVHKFTAQNIARYTWPRFLKSKGNAYCTAFADVLGDLVDRLWSEAVVESLASTMEPPERLEYLSEIVTDRGDPPITLLRGIGSMRCYTATAYTPADLSMLGIHKQPLETFLALLKCFITDQPDKFQKQTASWHSKVSVAISVAGTATLRSLKLIPLRTGRWTSASTSKIYFPNSSDGSLLPIGISVAIIEDNAAKNPSRAKLFSQLGARQLTSVEVYKLILDQHRDQGARYDNSNVDCVVQHAWFLFQSPSQPPQIDLSKLGVASANSDMLHTGIDLYMDSLGSTIRMGDYFSKQSIPVRYIHHQYLTYAPPGCVEAWLKWLQSRLGVRTMPRLANSGTVSPEFQCIFNSSQVHDWLLLLKEQWKHYSSELQSSNYGPLRVFLSKCLVKCSDGKRHPLKEVYLAIKAILKEPLYQMGNPVLAVEDPDADTWQDFRPLGLKPQPDLKFYITILQYLQAGSTYGHIVQDVERLYLGINQHFRENPTIVMYVTIPHIRCKYLTFIGTSSRQRA